MIPAPLRHLAPALAAAALAADPPPAPTPVLDFDHDGRPERVLAIDGTPSVQSRTDAGAWAKADFNLPDDVVAAMRGLADAGLRFIDLNGDGFDDILLSNDRFCAIHLWTRTVQPALGWTKGWSHPVRSGPRSGDPAEPPSLVGASVTLEQGSVVVRRPAAASAEARDQRIPTRALIAMPMPAPLNPAAARGSFRLRPGFTIDVVAAEPLVIDPVNLDWGADGRLWVVEMRDYPLGVDGRGAPGGVIKVLDDADGDGRPDRATVFLDGIAFPSGVMPWGRGALVSAAPDLFYAEDTDGDGRADVRRVLFTGFNPGNQQHRFNGFEWGLDGWVYAANGDSGGTVTSILTGKTLAIGGRDIRFKPDTGEIETVSAQTQFGRRRDDWGRWFGNNNPSWLWHVRLPEHYLRRNPSLAVPRVLEMLANGPDSTRVFPVAPALQRPNQPWSLNHVTSGCSPTPCRDDLFGPAFTRSVFISEPVHNVIHREVLSPQGSGWQSRRAPDEATSEFLASTDPWFRPTATRFGPDGALWIADMYRFVLEHPEWIPAEMQQRVNVRAGDDRGRIHRVAPDGAPRRPVPNLARLDAAGLVSAMDSPSGWQRDMAMRLLCQQRAIHAAASLRGLLTPTHAPVVRLQALATLGALGALESHDACALLADPYPGVRIEALRQAERLAPREGALLDAVAALASDGDAEVRLQAAFSLGAWPLAKVEPALRLLAARSDLDPWTRAAIRSSLPPGHPLDAALKTDKPLPPPPAAIAALKPSSADRAAVVARYAETERLEGNLHRGQSFFATLCAPCHRLRGQGNEVGPDLDMVGSKPTSWLIHAILDPNQAVEARYRAWEITLDDGETLSGIVSAETANNLVLRTAAQGERPVLRNRIRKGVPTPQSLMPAGFESALGPQDLADLIRWIRSP